MVAVGSRSVEWSRVFADRYGWPIAHSWYGAPVADPGVVYVATPHPAHHPHALLARRCIGNRG